MGWRERLATILVGTPIREATQSGGYDPDANLNAAQMGSSYVRRLTGQTDRQLPAITQERAIELAFWLYQTNPLGKRITKLVRDFVLGDGLDVAATAEDEKSRDAVQTVIDRFWRDPYNRMDMTLHDYVLELGLFGELVLPATVNPKSGHVRLGYVDPADIAQVVTEPDNVRIVRAVVLKAKMGQEQEVYKIIRTDDEPTSKTYGRLMGVAEGEMFTPKDGPARQYKGQCFYFRVNGVSNSVRGWPDMMAVADWIDGFDQMAFNEIDRSLLLKSFVWDVTLTGADMAAVDAKAKSLAVPKPGSVKVHNDKEVWLAVTPDLKAADASASIDLIQSVIATGAGLPKTWLNGLMDVNRATASELGEPAYKELTMRQRYVRYCVEQMAHFVLDQAELAGVLPKRKMVGMQPEPWAITINTPEIRGKDLNQAADTLFKLTQALAVAVSEKAIDTELEQQVLKLAIEQLGVDVDLDALKERMAAAKEEADAKAEDVPPVVPPNTAGTDEYGNPTVEELVKEVAALLRIEQNDARLREALSNVRTRAEAGR